MTAATKILTQRDSLSLGSPAAEKVLKQQYLHESTAGFVAIPRGILFSQSRKARQDIIDFTHRFPEASNLFLASLRLCESTIEGRFAARQ